MDATQIEAFKKKMAMLEAKALDRPMRLVKVSPGFYIVALPRSKKWELVDISHDKAGWIARSQNQGDRWFSDPYQTLQELKEVLGI